MTWIKHDARIIRAALAPRGVVTGGPEYSGL
jgi:hypothetical protein